MTHYLWCTQCDIIKPKIASNTQPPPDYVWICKNCGNEVFEVAVPEGVSLLEFPLELLKLMIVSKDDINGKSASEGLHQRRKRSKGTDKSSQSHHPHTKKQTSPKSRDQIERRPT